MKLSMSNRQESKAALDEHRERVVTPEAVQLHLDLAGLGSRAIAVMIDFLIQGVVLLAIGLGFIAVAAGGGGTRAMPIVFAVAAFLVLWGYHPFCEGLWRGRTPGKRAQRLRVVASDGQPASGGAIIVRNILRIVDFLPFMYGIGVVAMVLGRRSQRLGDLAAGTIVVRDLKPVVPDALPLPVYSDVHTVLDPSAVTQTDYELVRSFLARRHSLKPQARAELARSIAAPLRQRTRYQEHTRIADEPFLEMVIQAVRGRFSGGSN